MPGTLRAALAEPEAGPLQGSCTGKFMSRMSNGAASFSTPRDGSALPGGYRGRDPVFHVHRLLQPSGDPDGSSDDADPLGRAHVAAVGGIEGPEHDLGRAGVGHVLDPLRAERDAVPEHEDPRRRGHRPAHVDQDVVAA